MEIVEIKFQCKKLALLSLPFELAILIYGTTSNLHYTRRITRKHVTRGITPERITSGGAHLRGLASGQQSFEETLQR